MNTIEELYQAYKSASCLSTDTRNISQGSLFVALKGERFDANTMLADAFQRGAAYAVTSNAEFASDPRVFFTPDTLKTLQDLASYHRDQLSIPVVGITGTNGKTTTKELITAVLSSKFKTAATKGNLNNHIGVPLTLLSIRPDDEVAVVEMGANHPGEIAALAAIAKPTIGLVTNVGLAHIQGFGSLQGVKDTKAALYRQLISTGGTAVYDSDNDDIVDMIADYDNIVPYIAAKKVPSEAETLSFEWADASNAYQVATNLCGDYNIKNAQAAITVGLLCGVEPEKIDAAIEGYTPTNGRSQALQTARNHVIVDAYNANPSSMNAALDNFEARPNAAKCVILGAMGELGPEQEPQHLKVLNRLRSIPNLDCAILIGQAFAMFKAQFPSFQFFPQTADAKEAVSQLSGKYILLKGSNSNHLDQLIDSL